MVWCPLSPLPDPPLRGVLYSFTPSPFWFVWHGETTFICIWHTQFIMEFKVKIWFDDFKIRNLNRFSLHSGIVSYKMMVSYSTFHSPWFRLRPELTLPIFFTGAGVGWGGRVLKKTVRCHYSWIVTDLFKKYLTISLMPMGEWAVSSCVKSLPFPFGWSSSKSCRLFLNMEEDIAF